MKRILIALKGTRYLFSSMSATLFMIIPGSGGGLE
jgi:hypothetical protein